MFHQKGFKPIIVWPNYLDKSIYTLRSDGCSCSTSGLSLQKKNQDETGLMSLHPTSFS